MVKTNKDQGGVDLSAQINTSALKPSAPAKTSNYFILNDKKEETKDPQPPAADIDDWLLDDEPPKTTSAPQNIAK